MPADPRPTIHVAAFADLDPATLYALLRLRVDIFVVEQDCPYPELDGRDAEPEALHLWTADDNGPTAYLRILTEPDGDARIGRVVVRGDARGAGLAGQLLQAALTRIDGRRCVLHAQAHLVGLYARHGFVATGPESLEDRIPHVPMAREATPTSGSPGSSVVV